MTIDRRDVTAFAVLLTLASITYAGILDLNPFSADDIRSLFWADRVSAGTALRGDLVGLPAWRPLPDFIGWLYYRSFQLGHLHARYVINLGIWTACAWMVWRIVHDLTHSFASGLLAAAILLVDPRAIVTVIVLEHASSLACFFGMLALLLVITAAERPVAPSRWGAVALLLLASSLSKEYGLAFTGAVAVWSLLTRRRHAAVAATAAAAAYAFLRITFARNAAGTAGLYCHVQGYFFTTRTVCYDAIRADVISQSAYNIVATAIGGAMPGLLSNFGGIGIDPPAVAASIVCLATIALGCTATPRYRWLLLLTAVWTAGLSFMLYRDRDHVVAMCAYAIASGLGIASLRTLTDNRRWRRLLSAGAGIVLTLVIAARAQWTRESVSMEVAQSHALDPCDALGGPWPVDREFVKRLKVEHGMTDPDCTHTPTAPLRDGL